ncbi:uncharacterized protein LOC100899801 [Galendromus occidentalis]|uniref:Uncharacterized protein LOC100899801 n=1 Tax=Galendromus occidentalis TaxID=34638 RepID=A0AAJ6W037_9ACAR|nr:uncharacterized protein LOC100899801 [Galendromus occidentalis]
MMSPAPRFRTGGLGALLPPFDWKSLANVFCGCVLIIIMLSTLMPVSWGKFSVRMDSSGRPIQRKTNLVTRDPWKKLIDSGCLILNEELFFAPDEKCPAVIKSALEEANSVFERFRLSWPCYQLKQSTHSVNCSGYKRSMADRKIEDET